MQTKNEPKMTNWLTAGWLSNAEDEGKGKGKGRREKSWKVISIECDC